jgi:AAA family ATP:ADP antiporter
MHPVWGIANTAPSPYRLLGWLFALAMDFYPTFVIGIFWAFINSISTHDFAKESYGKIYGFIKAGGLTATVISMFLSYYAKNSVTLIPSLIFTSSILTLISLIFIKKIITGAEKKDLEGYRGEMQEKPRQKKVLGMLSGLKFMITKPYVLGIFLITYFYDVIFTIIEYQTHVLLSIKTANNANMMNFFLFSSATVSQIIGLFLAFFLTSKILKSIELKLALLIMPVFSAILILSIFFTPHLITMLAAITLLPALHFSLNSPFREVLFIPTIKEIQFKSKAWMDSFGRTLSKSSASTVNMLFIPNSTIFYLFNTSFSLILTIIWAISAYSIGQAHQKTVDKKGLIS